MKARHNFSLNITVIIISLACLYTEDRCPAERERGRDIARQGEVTETNPGVNFIPRIPRWNEEVGGFELQWPV